MLELFTFEHARAYCYARSDLVVFTRPRSPTNSKLFRDIPEVFGAGLPAPETNLRGIVLGVWVTPKFCTGGPESWKIAFSAESSAFW